MKPKVYIETSVISYLASRPSRDVVVAARQAITVDWWENHRERFDLFISELVEEEMLRGVPEAAALRTKKSEGIESLYITEALRENQKKSKRKVVNFGPKLLSDRKLPCVAEEPAEYKTKAD